MAKIMETIHYVGVPPTKAERLSMFEYLNQKYFDGAMTPEICARRHFRTRSRYWFESREERMRDRAWAREWESRA